MIYLGIVAALVLGYFAWEKHIRNDERGKVVAEYNLKIDEQKTEARTLLIAESAKVDAANRALRDFKDNQENEDAINGKTISLLADKLHILAATSGGLLRDPNAKGCWNGSSGAQSTTTTSTSSGAADVAQGAGVLSADLSRLLLRQASIADEVNLAYISCRADAINLRR
jgi:hypothetical protein